jgi:predicted transcriptional regulator
VNVLYKRREKGNHSLQKQLWLEEDNIQVNEQSLFFKKRMESGLNLQESMNVVGVITITAINPVPE